MTDRPISPRICFWGAAPDTGNLGVSALCYSVLAGIARRRADASIVVYDEGRGIRSDSFRCDGRAVTYQRCGAWNSRRFYRPESVWNMRLSARVGGLANPGARALLSSSAVLDISGGDSFTDLYGDRRFRSVTVCKQMALEHRIPLILLPQTYGPFTAARHRRIAESILKRSDMAWARDQRSFEVLREMLGEDFDPARHGCGVDVAFALEPSAWTAPLAPTLDRWLNERPAPLVGVNVSGLIYNDAKQAIDRYGLKADYRLVILQFLRKLLRETDCNIVLVPHVLPPAGFDYESDPIACQAVARELNDESAGRLMILPEYDDPCHAKWFISQLDWFCGTRMHATIAAISSGVPTAAIAYSGKTLGVFETCGQGQHVADPRSLDTEQSVDHLWASWQSRGDAKTTLAAELPGVINQAQTQMDQIVAACQRTLEPAA
jgi:colanic acid/amylovoran biosynthesis protein